MTIIPTLENDFGSCVSGQTEVYCIMLKQKLTAMLAEIQSKTSPTSDYHTGFLDGQEAMLESILELLELNEKENKELDDFICSFANDCYVAPRND